MQEVQQLYDFKLKEAQLLSRERDSLMQTLHAQVTISADIASSLSKDGSDYNELWNLVKQRAELVVGCLLYLY